MNLWTIIQAEDNWSMWCTVCPRKIRIEYKSPVPTYAAQLMFWENHSKLAKSGAFGFEVKGLHNV